MRGTSAAPSAAAQIDVGYSDAAGNWPMRVRVVGLRPLPLGAYYEMYLTRGGRSIASCGTFTVHRGTTQVRLNAPEYRRGDGWIVVRHGPGGGESPPLLST